MGRSLSIWIVEDQDLYRDTLQRLIGDAEDMVCAVAAASCEELLARLEKFGGVPDIVLMDIGLPGISGIEGAARIRELSPTTRVLMLTVHEERENVFDAICAGASGYLLKPTPSHEILRAIRDVSQGAAPINAYIARKLLDAFRAEGESPNYNLTRREKEILQCMVDGLLMKEIADRLFVSYHTIDTHIRNIYEKLHVRSRSLAVAKAIRERLV